MIYLDTSVVVATITPEPNTEIVQDWMYRQEGGFLCISEWVGAEVSSAFGIKMRRGEYDVASRRGVLTRWARMRSRSLRTIPVPEEAFALVTRLINDPASVLRAGDALHLAIASLGGHSLATLDTRLAEAAVSAGVVVETVA